jgi:hypothetical protein
MKMMIKPRMNTKGMLLKDEVHQVVGCAMEVLIEPDPWIPEKPHENALVAEFELGANREIGVPRKIRTPSACGRSPLVAAMLR